MVDDCCPEGTGAYVTSNTSDSRITVLRHDVNQGVGGAVMTGYRRALEDGMQVMVKIDGDGQMDPGDILAFVGPIMEKRADYTKGNRFFRPENLSKMPRVRLVGNALLSFMTKFSSGYWNVFDPTNGYAAIHARVLRMLPLEKISKRYFFESDMLFRLSIIRAVVLDVPIDSRYGAEESNLAIRKILLEFMGKHISNSFKRIFYSYFLRDFSVASLEIVFGTLMLLAGGLFGTLKWLQSTYYGTPTTSGGVMLAALPVLAGFQLILAFINYDVQNTPKVPLISFGLEDKD